MKQFLDEDFLLESKSAEELYHMHARQLPIIDFHCHLSPKDIAENRQFENITEAWLEGDHYKWRAMRANGINEEYCTGNAEPFEKFKKWAGTVPFTMTNPLYHWTHLELKRYFNISGQLLTTETCGEIFKETSRLLKTEEFRVLGLLEKMKVEVICTTDDPSDDLGYHKAHSESGNNLVLLPAFRPDNAYAVNDPKTYNLYLEKLGDVAGKAINNYTDLVGVLEERVEYFHAFGCRLSDHGLDFIPKINYELSDLSRIFNKVRNGNQLQKDEIAQFKLGLLVRLGKLYHQYGWTQQYHLGALRNNNSRMLRILGQDTGFDSIGDFPQAEGLSHLLNLLDTTDHLSKTILYNLNPADNELFATMAGNFGDGTIAGKVQYGSAWWFLDQKSGMKRQLETLGNMGLLSRFVGMLTDSRSFLSFPRHEYFRRILCNLLGSQIEKGLLPNDKKWIGQMVKAISYQNAASYFNLPKENTINV